MLLLEKLMVKKDVNKVITFPSDVEYLEEIELASTKFAEKAGFDDSTIYDISIALTELVNNAIHHGNKNDKNKMVTVKFASDDKRISISISDEGKGFNISNLSDPLDPENIMAENGRGIYLVKALMDDVDYKSSETGTEIIIFKNKQS